MSMVKVHWFAPAGTFVFAVPLTLFDVNGAAQPYYFAEQWTGVALAQSVNFSSDGYDEGHYVGDLDSDVADSWVIFTSENSDYPPVAWDEAVGDVRLSDVLADERSLLALPAEEAGELGGLMVNSTTVGEPTVPVTDITWSFDLVTRRIQQESVEYVQLATIGRVGRYRYVDATGYSAEIAIGNSDTPTWHSAVWDATGLLKILVGTGSDIGQLAKGAHKVRVRMVDAPEQTVTQTRNYLTIV